MNANEINDDIYALIEHHDHIFLITFHTNILLHPLHFSILFFSVCDSLLVFILSVALSTALMFIESNIYISTFPFNVYIENFCHKIWLYANASSIPFVCVIILRFFSFICPLLYALKHYSHRLTQIFVIPTTIQITRRETKNTQHMPSDTKTLDGMQKQKCEITAWGRFYLNISNKTRHFSGRCLFTVCLQCTVLERDTHSVANSRNENNPKKYELSSYF